MRTQQQNQGLPNNMNSSNNFNQSTFYPNNKGQPQQTFNNNPNFNPTSYNNGQYSQNFNTRYSPYNQSKGWNQAGPS